MAASYVYLYVYQGTHWKQSFSTHCIKHLNLSFNPWSRPFVVTLVHKDGIQWQATFELVWWDVLFKKAVIVWFNPSVKMQTSDQSWCSQLTVASLYATRIAKFLSTSEMMHTQYRRDKGLGKEEAGKEEIDKQQVRSRPKSLDIVEVCGAEF